MLEFRTSDLCNCWFPTFSWLCSARSCPSAIPCYSSSNPGASTDFSDQVPTSCYLQSFPTVWIYVSYVLSLLSSTFFLIIKLLFLLSSFPLYLLCTFCFIRQLLFCICLFLSWQCAFTYIIRLAPRANPDSSTWIIATGVWSFHFQTCPPSFFPLIAIRGDFQKERICPHHSHV